MSDEPVSKAERQRALADSIIAGQQPEKSPARPELERLLRSEALAALDE